MTSFCLALNTYLPWAPRNWSLDLLAPSRSWHALAPKHTDSACRPPLRLSTLFFTYRCYARLPLLLAPVMGVISVLALARFSSTLILANHITKLSGLLPLPRPSTKFDIKDGMPQRILGFIRQSLTLPGILFVNGNSINNLNNVLLDPGGNELKVVYISCTLFVYYVAYLALCMNVFCL